LIEFLIKKGANEKKKSLLGQIPLDMIKLRDAKQLRRRKQKLQAAMVRVHDIGVLLLSTCYMMTSVPGTGCGDGGTKRCDERGIQQEC